MEQLHLGAAKAQLDALHAHLHFRTSASSTLSTSVLQEKDTPSGGHAPQRTMLKTLKRAYSASVTCLETHKQLSTYQALLSKKLGLKAYTKQDLSELRTCCEKLVYIIQLPHDRGTYTTALRLLSTVATGPDPVAFLLLEPHILPILRGVLDPKSSGSVSYLPHQPANSLLLLLQHLTTRHRLSAARHVLLSFASRDTASPLTAQELSRAEATCADLLGLAEDIHAEIWVGMIVLDLLGFVAKHPLLSFILLEQELYERVWNVPRTGPTGPSFDKLARRLEKLARRGVPEIEVYRREIGVFLKGQKFRSEEQEEKCRELMRGLLSFAREGEPRQAAVAISVLEEVARSTSLAALILTEPEFYSEIERTWAMGRTSVDTLYETTKKLLNSRLEDGRNLINRHRGDRTLDPKAAEEISDALSDLLTICANHDVYAESTIVTAASILLSVADSPAPLSPLLLEAPISSQIRETWNSATGAPRSQQVDSFLKSFRRLQAHNDFDTARVLISRLKHTREWSGLDSENVKPLCETVIECARDSSRPDLRSTAISALIDLAKSPADCASVLLRPDIKKSLDEVLKSGNQDVVELAQSVDALAIHLRLRDGMPRLLLLSESGKSELDEPSWQEYRSRVDELVRLYSHDAGSRIFKETVLRGLLVASTGSATGRDLLQQAGGFEVLFEVATKEDPYFQDALHEVLREVEGIVDDLMQHSETQAYGPRVGKAGMRLIQLARLDFAPWSTRAAIELLGTLAKRQEYADILKTTSDVESELRALMKMRARHAREEGRTPRLVGSSELSGAVGRIMNHLGLHPR